MWINSIWSRTNVSIDSDMGDHHNERGQRNPLTQSATIAAASSGVAAGLLDLRRCSARGKGPLCPNAALAAGQP